MREETDTFSRGWVIASVVAFVVVEVLIGGVVAGLVRGNYVSQMWHLKVQMLLSLGSYFVGGVAIGIISPRVRTWEPAVGAFISVALVLLISVFLPYRFMGFTLGKLVVGGGIAAALAFSGAQLGERLMGNLDEDGRRARRRSRQSRPALDDGAGSATLRVERDKLLSR